MCFSHRTGISSSWTGPSHQEPAHQNHPVGLPAQRSLSSLSQWHADREPPGRAMVIFRLPDARPARHTQAVRPAVPDADREGGPQATVGAGVATASVHPATHQGSGCRELPPKTEIVQRIELGGDQRDLYETVRLAMHEKVRQAVAEGSEPQPDRHPRRPAQTAPGLLRPAVGEACGGAPEPPAAPSWRR